MLFSLLAESTEGAKKNDNWISWVLIGVLVAVLVVSMILMNRRGKKREQEAQALIDAVKPGNKVKTIGGICGIVVEVNPEEDTFVLETGNEEHGKSYMKFVRQAILESDAIVPKPTAESKDEKIEEEPATDDVFEETSAPAEEEPASAEVPEEEKTSASEE